MDYDNTNTIIAFRNDKEGNEKKPDYKGKVNVDGIEKEIALWIGQTKNGNEMLKGKVTEPWKKPEAENKPAPVEDDFSDSIPF